MKLIWHIIWKDIRSERWALLFWATLYIAQIIFGLVTFYHDEVGSDFVEATWTANVLMVAAQFFMGYIMVVQLVQADAISGTRMFWLTRPISAGRLLQAKAWGAVLLFGLGPVLLRLPWWLYCGFTANDVGWAAVETVGWQLLLIAPAFLIASLTEDFGRALMWGLLLGLSLVGGFLFLYSWRLLGGVQLRYSGLLFSRLWLAALLLTAGAAVIAAHQFHTRRFVRSVALAVSLVLAVLVTGRIWPWDYTALFTQINDPAPVPIAKAEEYRDLQLTVGPTQAGATWRNSGEKENRTWIQQTMEVRGVPAGWGLGAVRLHQAWSWPDDAAPVENKTFYFGEYSQRQLRQFLGLPAWQGDAETVRWQEAKMAERRARGEPVFEGGVLYWKPQVPSAEDPLTLFGRTSVYESVVTRIRTHAPVGVAQVELEIGRPGKLFELPLKRGAIGSGASRAYRVGPWGTREENRAEVLLTTVRPSVRENGLWWADVMDRATGWRSSRGRDDEFIVVNRSDNTLGSASRSGDTSRSGRMVIGGVALRWDTMNIYSTKVIRNGKWVSLDPDWTEHVTLALINPTQLVRLIREIKTEKYELEPDTTSKPKSDKSF